MGADRVIRKGGGRVSAPVLPVRYQCPACLVSVVLDAYRGPPVCRCRPAHTVMDAERIVDPLDVVLP